MFKQWSCAFYIHCALIQIVTAGEVSRVNYVDQRGSYPVHYLTLTGVASGGVLTLVSCSGAERTYTSIETHRGETADSVLQRLDKALSKDSIDSWLVGGSGELRITTKGLELIGFPGAYALAGTELGLGVPRAPLFISGCYNRVRNETVILWENPPGEYDVVFAPLGPLDAKSTRCVLHDRTCGKFTIVGMRGKTFSNMGLIDVSADSQEEISSAPFTAGIMPNWCSWTFGSQTQPGVFEQGSRPDQNYNHNDNSLTKTFDGKPFYQIVKTKTADVRAGIWRKWLGLTPGHKYRVYVRLNTLAMDSCTNSWSLSFHVAANAPGGGGTAFTTDQLAGQAPLPDGSHGLDAAQMVAYGPGHTTKGGWVCSTMDIVLPPKVDTITTWLRHSGADSTGVGMDWIKVEDLSIGTQSK